MGFSKSLFSFRGFISRSEYWKAIILYVSLPTILLAFCAFLNGWFDFDTWKITITLSDYMTGLEKFTLFLACYVVFALTIGMLAIIAKRLRDISISPWLGLIYLILPISPITVLLFGMFPTNVNSYER